jgi:hypothetical protein
MRMISRAVLVQLAISVLALVCLTGVLILPQVDLPAFVVSPDGISKDGHTNAAGTGPAIPSIFPGMFHVLPTPRSIHPGLVPGLITTGNSGVEALLAKLCVHRC